MSEIIFKEINNNLSFAFYKIQTISTSTYSHIQTRLTDEVKGGFRTGGGSQAKCLQVRRTRCNNRNKLSDPRQLL